MPLLLVLILVLIAFGLLLVGFLTSSVLWAWVSVLVSAAAAVVLVVDTLQRRSAVRAGDTGGIPTTRAAGVDPDAEPPTAVAATPVSVPPPVRPVQADPVTEVIPVVRDRVAPPQARFGAPPEAERTIVMPVVQPSGSRTGPSGAASGRTPSGGFSSPSVTDSPPEPATSLVATTGPGLDLVKRDGSGTADPAAPAADGTRQDAGGPATVVAPAATGAAETPVDRGSADRPPVDQPSADQVSAERTNPPPPGDRTTAPPAGPGADDRPAAVDPGVEATSVVAATTAAGTASAVGTAPSAPGGSDGPAVPGGSAAHSGPSGSGDDEVASSGSPEVPPQQVPPQQEPSQQESLRQEAARQEVPSGGAEPPEEPRDEQAAALVARSEDEVLVVDEQPRYHVPGCRALVAAALIPLPVREAVELGFTPCGWCTPDRAVAGRHTAARS